jgi:hypothetical protein
VFGTRLLFALNLNVSRMENENKKASIAQMKLQKSEPSFPILFLPSLILQFLVIKIAFLYIFRVDKV